MKIVSIQNSVVTGDTETNVSVFSEMVVSAVTEGADIVVLPEMWASGFDYFNISKHGELSVFFIQKIQNILREGALAVLSLPEVHNKRVYNTVFAVSKSNIIAKYRKTFLFSPMNEDKYFAHGAGEPVLFEFKDAVVSLHTCYEIRFPELFRIAAYKGAGLMLVTAIWPESKKSHWLTLLRARAIENQCFVIGCNASDVKTTGKLLKCGYSVAFDPWGEIIGSLEGGVGVLPVEIELEKVSQIRGDLPSLKDAKSFFAINKI